MSLQYLCFLLLQDYSQLFYSSVDIRATFRRRISSRLWLCIWSTILFNNYLSLWSIYTSAIVSLQNKEYVNLHECYWNYSGLLKTRKFHYEGNARIDGNGYTSRSLISIKQWTNWQEKETAKIAIIIPWEKLKELKFYEEPIHSPKEINSHTSNSSVQTNSLKEIFSNITSIQTIILR